MTEQLAGWFVNNLGGVLRPEVIVFIVSLLPILELRGGILVGFLLGMKLAPSFIIAFIGNIIPVPFILMFIKFIFKKLKKTRMKGFIEKIENKAMSKSDQVQKYAYLGLLLFVGIPLPGTGAWTGSLIAALLEMDMKKSFGIIVLGVIMAGIIISILSYGVLGSIL
ncbi:COG2426 family protein [Anaerotignum sp. MSJ-24]|uniref:COG2426 family protein n=1 Tax=Anaerotignum sp. MSJ-24 TaxID=2841521 RepID=UPI001C0FF35A|nr:small multi-drug export protein [Anaerotignum sp. MSJ-24]MBU5463317.1 small multi-drug export protein [Anaerotignum sp. MSJ-24]